MATFTWKACKSEYDFRFPEDIHIRCWIFNRDNENIFRETCNFYIDWEGLVEEYSQAEFCDLIFRKIMTKLKSDISTFDLENLKIKIKVYNDKTKSISNANFNEQDGAWFSSIFKMENKIVSKVSFTFFSFKPKEISPINGNVVK